MLHFEFVLLVVDVGILGICGRWWLIIQLSPSLKRLIQLREGIDKELLNSVLYFL